MTMMVKMAEVTVTHSIPKMFMTTAETMAMYLQARARDGVQQ